MKCPVCGAPLKNGKCDYCGYEDRMETQTNVNMNPASYYEESRQAQQIIINHQVLHDMEIIPGVSRKNKTVALLLCIFLGGLGAHKFYVGKVGMGIIYLFTFGLFGFGWIIDIILIATGSFKDEFDLPLRK